jgi:hypothetical protein
VRLKKTISTEQTPANISVVTALLAEMPDKLDGLCRGLPDEQLHAPLGPGERSFVEVLAHLLNGEARAGEAIYSALLLDEPLLVDIHPERQWGRLLRYDLLPVPDLLAYFKLRRNLLMRVLTGLTGAQWSHAVRETGKQRRESVYWRARALALHEAEHMEWLWSMMGLPAKD